MMKPSPAAVFQAVKAMKPHVPMIKFRYGAAAGHSTTVRASAPSSPAAVAHHGAPSSSTPASPTKPNATITLPTIEDWQLPARYRRRPIDEVEVEAINQGGRY